MVNMGNIISIIREKYPQARVAVGGAPVNADFAAKIHADNYSRNPQEMILWLNKAAA
jgi:5-methyltetrahydrofolate--homocysteine methyltransferase